MKTKILIVEDEKIVAYDLQNRLEKMDYIVSAIISTGEEAVNIVDKNPPDLIIMDIKLQGKMDGIEAAEEIHKKHAIPIVYLTAFAEDKTLMRAKTTEPFAYILKPFEEQELKITIEFSLYRFKMQRLLAQREQRFHTTLNSINNAVIATDEKTDIQFINPVAESFIGIKKEQALGKKLKEVLQIIDKNTGEPIRLPSVKDIAKDFPDKKKNMILISHDGSKRSVESSFSPIKNENGYILGMVLVFCDISVRVKAEQALRKSEEQYRSFFEDDVAGNFFSTKDGKITACNPAFARILGFDSPEQVIQHNLKDFYPDFYEDSSFFELLKKEKKLKYYEARFLNKDKKELHITANVISQLNDSGELKAIKGYILDNTEEKKMKEQLLQSQKMQAIGRLAGGIAHDFNNLLGAIIGYTDLLLETLPADDPIKNDIQAIRNAGKKATVLTKQLLAFSRRQVLKPKIVDLNVLINEMEIMLKRLIPENIKLETILEENLWQVGVDPIQIEQVLINLAVNARDAMPDGGKLIIKTSNIVFTDDVTIEHIGIKKGEYVMLKISDTGIGIDPTIKAQIFEPFFTTKETGKGTGLGLSTVYGIIKQSDGYIFVDSEINKGTRFAIYLPHVEEELEKHEEKQEIKQPLSGNETILLVEDEDVFRNMLFRVLTKYGYNVLEAKNGGEALLICEQYKAPIHLMISDIIMPHLSGIKLNERLQKIHPQMKVLYISGYTNEQNSIQKNIQNGINFIQKPFSPHFLGAKIRELLSEE